MDIEDTKVLGLQLCNFFGFDSKGLIDWCNQTGNNWIGVPLYGAGDHTHNFNIRNGFNKEKPWFIDFVINVP